MTEKSLEEEVGELERFYAGEIVNSKLIPSEITLRLIADWRKLRMREARRILERVRSHLRNHCYYANPDCDEDAHHAVNHIIDPILDRMSWDAYDRAKKEPS